MREEHRAVSCCRASNVRRISPAPALGDRLAERSTRWYMRYFAMLALLLTPAGEVLAKDGVMREVKAGEFTVRLDVSRQVLRLDVPEDREYGREEGATEVPLFPTLAGAVGTEFTSASALAVKAKQFDDGLYAAVELAAEKGLDRFSGKAKLIETLANAVREAPPSEAVEILFSGAKLGGLRVELPKALAARVDDCVRAFQSNAVRSKPIGFYTWSHELSSIFQQDRMLQSDLNKSGPGIETIVRALSADEAMLTSYRASLELAERLTNPFAKDDFRSLLDAAKVSNPKAPNGLVHFFPPSRAHETDLIKKLYPDAPIPEGFNLADEMVKRIRAGTLKLAPTAASGWYDHQVFALEPLVVPGKMPEAAHLKLAEGYKRQLLELFKGILTLTRETHIKQLEIPAPGAARPMPSIDIYPDLSVEPLATHYLRRAQAYRFVRGVLEKSFGETGLAKMYRQTAKGPVAKSLGDELREMEALFYGAHVVATRQIGLKPLDPKGGSGKGTEADARFFESFAMNLGKDPDLGEDVRAMVPVFYDVARQKTKVWAFLGWASRPLTVSFETTPQIAEILHKGAKPVGEQPLVKFKQEVHHIAYPVTAEVYVSEILDRAEFRKHCDKYKSTKDILANLNRP